MAAIVQRPQIRKARLRIAVLGAGLAGVLLSPLTAPATAAAASSKPAALPAFASCASLLSYARRNARRSRGSIGVPTRAGILQADGLGLRPAGSDAVPLADTSAEATTGNAAPSPSSAARSQDVPSFSSTNVQEAGVDEPDIVKTDGRSVFAIAAGRLHAFDVRADIPRLVASIDIPGAGQPQLLIRGDRALVMTTSYSRDRTVVLSEVDIGDPAAMAVLRTLRLDGQLVDARLTGSSARVVVASSPGSTESGSLARASLRRFLPRTILRSRVTRRTLRRSVAGCDDVRHPRAFSGLDLLSVLTIDLDKGLYDVDRDAIMAGAQTVYGSERSLYVASRRYIRALESGRRLPSRTRTQIHRFDASKPGETSYAASGEVTGFVLNQYSMSEHDGALRVATTDEPQWFDGDLARESESFVTVLAQRGRALAPLGRADGLGRGERIFAVRFVGDKGYVVTFRQVDPLYTLDLSEKAHPKVLGELKIRGYSAYLHPVSDDLLLGVGQDASGDGRTLGTQLSLFDVSNLREPVRRARVSIADSSSGAEFDPHAFLFWKPSNLAVIPVSVHERGGFRGAIGFGVGASSLTEAGRITHPVLGPDASLPAIARSLVIDDRLYTLSYAGLQSNKLDTLAAIALAPFPAPPRERDGRVR